MIHLRIQPQRLMPWVMSGASGLHIIVRLWRVTRAPASVVSVRQFLSSNLDVLVMLCGSPVVWLIARRQHRLNGETANIASFSHYLHHQLREVFTILLIGLGLVKRRAAAGEMNDVVRLTNRLIQVVHTGVKNLSMLEPYHVAKPDAQPLGNAE